jgi:starch phosphorylase
MWVPGETVMAMAHDLLVPGYETKTVTALRLWSSRASAEFSFQDFNKGDYIAAVENKVFSESISKVLYPNENILQGKELRLKQEYMLVSATLQDAMKTFHSEESDINRLPERAFFQMNDTHPALSVAELMRILVDVEGLEWDHALSITRQCLGYTNHTVMPEALEKWEIDMFGNLLPRHLEIIYTLNFNFLEELNNKKLPLEIIEKLSLIEEKPVKSVRMANLAILGSRSVNGVAALHTELIKERLFKEFSNLWPEKFQNKTNGITHRRWLLASNRLYPVS